MRCPAGEYATKVWTLLEISCQATEQSFLVANHTYWSVIGDLYDFEVQLDKSCKPGVWRLAVLANLFVLGRLVWICVPLCVWWVCCLLHSLVDCLKVEGQLVLVQQDLQWV